MKELLTPEEFAVRLKIGRSTLFEWLSKGVLVPGKHYFRVGRVLRFVWNDDAISNLLELSVSKADSDARALRPTMGAKRLKPRGKEGPPINWDY